MEIVKINCNGALMKTLLCGLASLVCLFASNLVTAEDSILEKPNVENSAQESALTFDADLADHFDQLRSQFRKNKAAVVGSQMNLSATELEVFWRVYGEYEHELVALNDKRIESINYYLENFNKMSAEKATSVLEHYFANQRARISLREKYAGKISRILSPLVGLRFTHVEAQISLFIEAELLIQLPFAELDPVANDVE